MVVTSVVGRGQCGGVEVGGPGKGGGVKHQHCGWMPAGVGIVEMPKLLLENKRPGRLRNPQPPCHMGHVPARMRSVQASPAHVRRPRTQAAAETCL
jgi:hypothetical protein